MIDYCISCLDQMKKEYSYKNIFRIFCGHGDRTAIQFTHEGEIKKITFAEHEFVAEYNARKIKNLLAGKEKGFVILKLENKVEWFGIFWGIMMAGYKPFLVDYRHNDDIVKYFIGQSNAVGIITAKGGDFGGDIVSIKADDIITCDKAEIFKVIAEADKSGTVEDRINSFDWADEVALCTSGTTSTAKTYIYNGFAIANQVLNAYDVIKENEVICSDREMRNLAFLPLNHIFGFMANYLWYSFFSAAQVVPANIAPSTLLATCREHKVTHMLAVPLLVNNIAKGIEKNLAKQSSFKRFMFKTLCNISVLAQKINPMFGIKLAKKIFKSSVLNSLAGTSLECIIVGGGHVLPEAIRTINAIGYYTLCGFGMTEVGITSLETNKSFKRRTAGGVGIPLDSVEYRIVPMSSDENAKKNVGELQIRGKSLHSHMLKDGEYIPTAYNEEGWFATGDIGRLEKDSLYIEGRLKEVIINESGENVYPDELEDLFINLEGVSNFTILGIKKAKNSNYEDIVLVCQTAESFEDEEYIKRLTAQIAAQNAKLAVYKKLNYVLLTNDPLPLSNGIKVRRVVIKRQAENGEGNFFKIEKLK